MGDGGATSGSEGAGDPSGVKNCSSTATMPSSDEGSERDMGRGGIGRGDDDVGDGVVARDSCNGRKMSRLMGSSPLSTAGGRGPFNLIA